MHSLSPSLPSIILPRALLFLHPLPFSLIFSLSLTHHPASPPLLSLTHSGCCTTPADSLYSLLCQHCSSPDSLSTTLSMPLFSLILASLILLASSLFLALLHFAALPAASLSLSSYTYTILCLSRSLSLSTLSSSIVARAERHRYIDVTNRYYSPSFCAVASLH